MRFVLFLFSVLLTLSLSNCASYDFSRKVVEQGNLLPQSMISRLKIGMSKEDAAILTGTSLLSPLFNQNRWDYAYTIRKGNGVLHKRNLVLHFSHNRLAHIEHKP